MRGSLRFLTASYLDDDEIPTQTCGVFVGDYEVDDFIYYAEVHFVDTQGVIYERPRITGRYLWPIDVCCCFVTLEDPTGAEVPLIREPGEVWEPQKGRATGRIAHMLYEY